MPVDCGSQWTSAVTLSGLFRRKCCIISFFRPGYRYISPTHVVLQALASIRGRTLSTNTTPKTKWVKFIPHTSRIPTTYNRSELVESRRHIFTSGVIIYPPAHSTAASLPHRTYMEYRSKWCITTHLPVSTGRCQHFLCGVVLNNPFRCSQPTTNESVHFLDAHMYKTAQYSTAQTVRSHRIGMPESGAVLASPLLNAEIRDQHTSTLSLL